MDIGRSSGPAHRSRRRGLRVTLAIGGAAAALLVAFGLVRLSSAAPVAAPDVPPPAGSAATVPSAPTPSGTPTDSTPSPSRSAKPSPVASRSATPSPQPREESGAVAAGPCPAFPRFPDASCTGWRHTGVKLRKCTNTIRKNGAKLDGCRFVGGLTIEAKNVTITRSLVEGLVGATYLTNWSLEGLRLVDVEIDGGGEVDPNGQAAIGSDNYTCIRCHIHGTGRGANMGNNVHIEDSYLHGWVYVDGAHQTAIGSNGGSNFTVVHNNLVCDSEGCSAALSLYGDFAPIDNALIEKNLFNTSGGYCTYGGSTAAKPHPIGTRIRYLNNRFGKKYYAKCGYYGPVATFEFHSGNVWQGNEWQDGSGPVKPQS